MRLAILSNVTVDLLANMMRERHEVWTAPGFGSWAEISLSPPAELSMFSPDAVAIVLDSSRVPFDGSLVSAAVDSLRTRLGSVPVLVPDVEDLAVAEGDFYDERMWRLASSPWSLHGLRAISVEIERLAAYARGGLKKVLAVDLDGVLWDGVAGEDGCENLLPRTEFQKGLKKLKERGILLVALSKNNPEDVEGVWNLEGMVLRKDDFAAMRIGWQPKSDSLADCAKELGLGIDSFVFVDDNPGERAEMSARCPSVVVPDFPVTARRLARLWFPSVGASTSEDRARTDHYRAEAARREFSKGLSLDEYLEGLDIRTDIHEMREDEIPRVAQLSRRSNQFNVTTNRYTESDIRSFAADPSRLVMTMSVSDKFGDLGLVAFAHACGGDIVDWVMSCRAMNRRVEFALESAFEARLAVRGIRILRAAWRRTAKNRPAIDLFDKFGFILESDTGDERRYAKELPARAPSPPIVPSQFFLCGKIVWNLPIFR